MARTGPTTVAEVRRLLRWLGRRHSVSHYRQVAETEGRHDFALNGVEQRIVGFVPLMKSLAACAR